MDDLERGVGFAGACGHDQQDALLPARNDFDRAVDGGALVVARGLTGVVVVLGHAAHLGRPTLPGAITAPQFLRRGELVKAEVFLQHAIGHRGVAEHKAVAVAGEAEGHVKELGVVDGLGHARAHGLVVVFGLDHRDGDVGLEEQRVVSLEDGGCISVGRFAPHADATCPQTKLMKHLRHRVPPGLLNGGRDETGADVALGELFFVQAGARVGIWWLLWRKAIFNQFVGILAPPVQLAGRKTQKSRDEAGSPRLLMAPLTGTLDQYCL